jgi:prepilin-type N-terminal cleavage/methylation domain-containing protein
VRKKGFTIIELMVVMVVISILVGVTLPRFKGMRDEANLSKVEAELKTLQIATESYYINQNPNAYPTTTDTLVSDYFIGAEPNIISAAMVDPFQTGAAEYNYFLSLDGAKYVIFSHGFDGVADITGISNTGELQGIDDDDIFVSNGLGIFG